jgi:hypothetical protein
MRRLPVIEYSKRLKYAALSGSVSTERNRVISWDSTVQGLNKPAGVTPSTKIAIILRPFGFVNNITKLILASLARLPYTFFRFAYEGAKLVAMGLSSIRRVLFVAK